MFTIFFMEIDIVVGAVLKVLLRALEQNQSTFIVQHLFNTQRALVFKYHSALFDEESGRLGDLCWTLFAKCSSPLSAVRSHTTASLYLLMKLNFEIGIGKSTFLFFYHLTMSNSIQMSFCIL